MADPNNPGFDLNEYYLGPDSFTQGFEVEANTSLGYGFNVYANGTVGKANYTGTGVPSGLNVADTPAYTQGLGVTYQAHGMDLGLIKPPELKDILAQQKLTFVALSSGDVSSRS